MGNYSTTLLELLLRGSKFDYLVAAGKTISLEAVSQLRQFIMFALCLLHCSSENSMSMVDFMLGLSYLVFGMFMVLKTFYYSF